MSINSLIFLLLSNSITSRRDKSILCILCFKTTIIFSVIHIFISLLLDWRIGHFCILGLVTLLAFMLVLHIYNTSNKELYYNGDMLAIFTGYYLSLVEKTIAHSAFNDSFLAINITIGLSMIILSLLNNRKTISIKDKFLFIKDKFLFIMENKEFLFISWLAMLFLIFTVNMILSIVGLGITVDTSSITLFLYTFFPKVIGIKLILILIFCSITKELKLDNVSLSLSSVIFMVLLGSVNYYCVMPYVKLIMCLGLLKLDNIFTRVSLFIQDSIIIGNNNETLADGFYNIIAKCPIIGKYFKSFRINKIYPNYISSPFRLYYKNVIKNIINIYPLTKVSKLTTVFMPRIAENKLEASYLYERNINNLEVLLKNNSLSLTGLISNFVSKYSNLTCKINLICADQIVSINTKFKNGNLEAFNLERTNLKFANSKVDKEAVSNIYSLNSKLNKEFSKDLFDISAKYNRDYFYDPSEDRTRELLRLTDPSNNGYNLQMFMQKGISNNDYHLQEGEASIGTGELSNLNRGKKRQLEFNDSSDLESTGEEKIYSCIVTKMIKLVDAYSLFLSFDLEKLSTEGERYLEEICIKGRTTLFEHYTKDGKTTEEVRALVDNYSFKDISISPDIDKGYTHLFNAFYEKPKNTFKSSNIEDLKPFSIHFIEGDKDYSSSSSEGDASSDDYTELKQSGLTIQEVNILLEGMKNRALDLFTQRKSQDEWSKACLLKDINLTYSGEVLVDANTHLENDFTKLLMQLAEYEKGYFNLHGKDISILRTSVHKVYNHLIDSIREPLVKDEIHLIINTLENLKNHLLESRKNTGDISKKIFLTDFLERSGPFISEKSTGDKSTGLVTHDFTRLFEYLIKENKQLAHRFKKNVPSLIKELKELVNN